MLTFLPMDEVNRLSALEGAELNHAKEVLAFEVTKLVHGEEEAKKAQDGARAAFGGGGSIENMPTTKMDVAQFEGEGYGLASLLKDLGLESSNSEAFRSIQQGGVKVGGEKITDKKATVTADMFTDGKLLIEKGKKKKHVVEI